VDWLKIGCGGAHGLQMIDGTRGDGTLALVEASDPIRGRSTGRTLALTPTRWRSSSRPAATRSVSIRRRRPGWDASPRRGVQSEAAASVPLLRSWRMSRSP